MAKPKLIKQLFIPVQTIKPTSEVGFSLVLVRSYFYTGTSKTPQAIQRSLKANESVYGGSTTALNKLLSTSTSKFGASSPYKSSSQPHPNPSTSEGFFKPGGTGGAGSGCGSGGNSDVMKAAATTCASGGGSDSSSEAGMFSCEFPGQDIMLKDQLKIKRRNAIIGQIINADMSDSMRELAIEAAMKALDKFRDQDEYEKDVAAAVKREFDKNFLPTWHCIVGKNFGSYLTHEIGSFIYFYLGSTAVLLFRNG